MTMARRKLPLMLPSAVCSLSAVPEKRTSPSSGRRASTCGTTRVLMVSIASSRDMPSGGETCSVTVRRRSMRRISLGPAVRSIRASSLTGSTPPGVASGIDASSSGVSQRGTRTTMSMRCSPSK